MLTLSRGTALNARPPDLPASVVGNEEAVRSFCRLLDFLPVPVAVDLVVGFDEQGEAKTELLFHNRRFLEVLGYTVEELRTGADWQRSVYPNDDYRREVLAHWQTQRRVARDEGATFVTTTSRIRCKDGEFRWFEIVYDFERAISEGFVVFAFTDVTRRKEMQQELERQVSTDYLTGLTTRRAMQEQLDRQAARSERSQRSFAVVIGDLDDFKVVNDVYGHEAGDMVLSAVGKAIAGTVRAADVAARWGGEEILLLLPDMDMAGAMHLALRVCEEVEAVRVETAAGNVEVGITLGVAIHEPGDEVRLTLRRADDALYRGKAAGGRRAVQALLTTDSAG